jgi:hypothetical protein
MLKHDKIHSNWALGGLQQGRSQLQLQRQRSAANGHETGQRISRGACDAPPEPARQDEVKSGTCRQRRDEACVR